MDNEIASVESLNSQVVLSAGEGVDLKELLAALKNCKTQPPQQLADIHNQQLGELRPLREVFHPKNVRETVKRDFTFATVNSCGFIGFATTVGAAVGKVAAAATPDVLNYMDPTMLQTGGVIGFIAGCVVNRYVDKWDVEDNNEMITKMQKSVTLIENNVPKIGQALHILRNGSPSEKVVVNAVLPVLFQEAILQVENAIQIEEQRNHAELFARATAVLGNEKNDMIPLIGGRSAIQDKLSNK